MAVLISHRFSTVRMADRIFVWPMAKLWSKVRTSN
jgi:ABC-type multidrug transport system fused ATPase/permease subunit